MLKGGVRSCLEVAKAGCARERQLEHQRLGELMKKRNVLPCFHL